MFHSKLIRYQLLFTIDKQVYSNFGTNLPHYQNIFMRNNGERQPSSVNPI